VEPTIEVRALRKRYRTTVAVDGLSFTVRAGEVTGFIGPNGAGKSTTMRLLLDLIVPTRESATLSGATAVAAFAGPAAVRALRGRAVRG